MSDYRVEKVRHRVDLTLIHRVSLAGDIFLQAATRHRVGPEEPVDALNAEAPFLPLELDSGDVVIVQKSHIFTLVTMLPERDDTVERGVLGMHVEFTLSDGSVWSGSIFPEQPADRPRLVDFLNDTTRRFVALFTRDRVVVINREHLSFARPRR